MKHSVKFECNEIDFKAEVDYIEGIGHEVKITSIETSPEFTIILAKVLEQNLKQIEEAAIEEYERIMDYLGGDFTTGAEDEHMEGNY